MCCDKIAYHFKKKEDFMKLFKKSLSVFIIAIMLLTSVSLQGLAGVTVKLQVTTVALIVIMLPPAINGNML